MVDAEWVRGMTGSGSENDRQQIPRSCKDSGVRYNGRFCEKPCERTSSGCWCTVTARQVQMQGDQWGSCYSNSGKRWSAWWQWRWWEAVGFRIHFKGWIVDGLDVDSRMSGWWPPGSLASVFMPLCSHLLNLGWARWLDLSNKCGKTDAGPVLDLNLEKMWQLLLLCPWEPWAAMSSGRGGVERPHGKGHIQRERPVGERQKLSLPSLQLTLQRNSQQWPPARVAEKLLSEAKPRWQNCGQIKLFKLLRFGAVY